ncbi:MAG: carboxylating nicotinate-nucleotide diphosphorylase [Armatimonadetes bacterium]|nr:carboxylating nicotinate-nucleotide diphosphorylase [Armatimonadota bacterium]NIM23408.1 carboxylating nicotinate-nucleotide diphosphorylase [Armatimonadota bacterium]NIM67273.1 carboxylating nicotinate-nucleotide diphosphorylase [Armatimonadota bacterium]NIM75771.1 carboxylating nicotinate-nucleotide diphosphorylase [Armatimonadota bacterium]NIN05459.1 carboxylating nicotinate-nucleotide diphosphorylase [Armatimonadota bacterium]
MDQVGEIVRTALAEDIGSGDITTAAIVDSAQQGRAVIVAKEEGIIAGLPVVREAFLALDSTIRFNAEIDDGNRVTPNTRVATIAGPVAPILTAERTALNFLMRISGIATLTARFVEAIAGTRAKILDTRKTAPGLRLLDKYAVRMGGGQNHRFGLYDAILIKENHISAAGSITAAVERMKSDADPARKIEVEARSLEEVKEALAAGAEMILLDNMELAAMAESVKLTSGRAICEASGGVTLENVRAVAETGVDFISIGLLTHSAAALDFSLELL